MTSAVGTAVGCSMLSEFAAATRGSGVAVTDASSLVVLAIALLVLLLATD